MMKSAKWIAAAAIAATAFVSCSNDDDNTPSTPAVSKPYIVTMAYAPASGYNYSYYTVPFGDIMSGTISAKGQGTEQVGYFDYTKIGNTIYAIGGLDDVKVTAIQQNSDSSLKEVGSTTFPAALSDLVEGDSNNLVGVSMAQNLNTVTFYQIAKNSVAVTKTVSVPVSKLYTGTNGISYTGMAVSGNQVFVSYYEMNPNTYATPSTDQATVAVFSYPDFTFQKVITDSRVGPIGGFNVKDGLIKDESGNIFAVSHSNPANGYSQSTKPAGILKIANGSTTFDANYFWQAADNAIVSHMKYISGGNAFAEINTTARASQAAWSDGSLQSAIINLNNKTVNYISGIPAHKGQGRRLPILVDGNNIYTPVSDGTSSYIYKTDLSARTATKGAQAQASFVPGIFKY